MFSAVRIPRKLSSIGMAVLGCLALAFRNRAGYVTAFSVASIGARSVVAGSKPLTGRAFLNRQHRPAVSSILRSQSVATATELEKSLDVTHPAFEVVDKDIVGEYGAYCTLYRHKKSGAELLSVSSEDDNKVFGITFRTPPSDSTGVPHILEHSVLCGSRKYKTKDPFVTLLQGSLQTFLNAFTYPDRTCYVVASQNTKDFYNLVNVYADAVFYPRAIKDPMVHAQEGWHLELEDKKDPLTYKGVVYNEMKGVYSSSDSLLMRASQRALFPDNTYGVDSGGDPAVIPELSFEQFVQFHQKFYHPANSRIYFAGDDDVYKRLELMDEYLSEFGPSPESRPGSEIQWQPKSFAEPRREVRPYPTSAGQPETHFLLVNWLLNDRHFTPMEELALQVLDHLLMGTPSSILKKTLMESGLGAAIVGGGVSDVLLQATFGVGLKGIEPSNVDAVEKLIHDTLATIATEGFSDDAIAASMNTVEFELREFNTGSFPRGLSLMLGSMSKWIYDRSPTDALKFEPPLAELKASIAESGSKIFQDMLSELLVNNSHRATIEMVPSKTYEQEMLKDELDRLEAIKSSLSDEDLDKIISSTAELKKLQASEDPPEAKVTIPTLQLSDLERKVVEYPIEVYENEEDSGVTVIRHELGSTSGIVYAALGVDLSSLPLDDIVLLPIFTRLLTEAGAGEYDPVALSRRIGTYTGDISASVLDTPVYEDGVDEDVATDCTRMVTKLVIKGKATSENAGELFSLFNLILRDARLDSKSKVIEMLRESKARMESSIQGSGHSFSVQRMRARYTPAGYIDEKKGGIAFLDSLKSMLKQAEEDWPSFLARMEALRDTILDCDTCRDGMFLDLTGDEKVFSDIKPDLAKFLKDLPGNNSKKMSIDFYKDEHPWVTQAKKEMEEMAPLIDEGFVVPTQVSYVGKGGRLFSAGEKMDGTVSVVSKFLRTGYIWDQVRVIGGAYGGFCVFGQGSGFFGFVSYRDPNLAKTLDVYDAAADAVEAAADEFEKDRSGLDSTIIGTIGDMDSALSPDAKGWKQLVRWITHESPEHRQRLRDEAINAKPEDFRAFAQRLRNLKDPSIAVISSKPAFESAAKDGKELTLRDIV